MIDGYYRRDAMCTVVEVEAEVKKTYFVSRDQVSPSAMDKNTAGFSEDNIHLYWYRKAKTSTHDVEVKWKNLVHEENFGAFTTLLKRLSEFPLNSSMCAYDVVEVIHSVTNSQTVCKLVFEAAMEADQDCDDRPLSIFNSIQGLAKFGKLEAEGGTPQKLLLLAKGIARLNLLDEAVIHLMNHQWKEGRRVCNNTGNGPNMNEALEFQMTLRRSLWTELDLPFPVLAQTPHHFYLMEQLTESDKEIAKSYVNQAISNEDRLVEILINQPLWKQYMERLCEKGKMHIDLDFRQRMEKIEEDQENKPQKENDYLIKMNGLAKARQQKINELLKHETRQLCSNKNEIFCRIF